MLSRIKVNKTMRNSLVLALLAVCGILPAASTTQSQPDWIVVSSGKIDIRIERQFQQHASQRHAGLRFTHDGRKYGASASNSSRLVFLLATPADRQTFLEELRKEAGASAITPTADLADEGYILRIDYSGTGTPNQIAMQAATPRGLHHALLRIPDILAIQPSKLETELIPRPQSVRLTANGAQAVIADYPSVPMRGVVEGFYGQPWSHSDRLDILRFEGQHGMNLYLYGPKDDPYHRKLWRDPYPPDQLKHLGELARTARENFVDFSFAISPGLSMTYSSDADFQALTRKVESVRKLGVTNFALFLDDVPQDLAHAEDRARFHSLANAHIQLIHRLYDYLQSLSSSNRLTVCPTTYTNEWGSREYIRELGAGLRPEIPIDWTGTEVIPPTITVDQANQWAQNLHRKPLVWDNYPTNDGNNALLNIDPLRGRDPRLFTSISGLFSNPMNQAHLTMIPLQTIADYLWNPVAYAPQPSQQHAIISQYGPDALALLDPLLRIYTADGGDGLIFKSLFDESWTPVDVPAIELQISRLHSLVASLRGQSRFDKLVAELTPIPDTLEKQLDRLRNEVAFKHLPDGRIEWNREQDTLRSFRNGADFAFDGDFAKWESHRLYQLNSESQIMDGQDIWKGPSQFSARVALAWDEEDLYFGIDVTDLNIYQPYSGRGAQNGDAFRLVLNTQLPVTAQLGRLPSVFDLYLSPGNFAGVQPSIYCDEDFFPLRPQAHDYGHEIKAVWKKTATGFSGDVIVPAAFFARQSFVAGQQIGLSFGVQKAFAPRDPLTDDPARIIFSSKGSNFFPVDPENPATLQQMELLNPQDGSAPTL